MPQSIDSGATFSADRRYRYNLWRRWSDEPMLMVIGLNPSTADEHANDPTVRRCIDYAKRWGLGGLHMMNLFAFRATNPAVMRAHYTALGARGGLREVLLENLEEHIIPIGQRVHQNDGGALLAAWGHWGAFLSMSQTAVSRIAQEGIPVACLGLTQSGQPRHALYLLKGAQPVPFIGDGCKLCR